MLAFPWLSDALQRFDARLARGQNPQALLVHGPAGIGRRYFALTVAARLLGIEWAPPTNAAADDLQGVPHPDCFFVGPGEDSSVIKVDQIREFNRALSLTSHRGGWKVGLISPAERMNHNAANTLLKTLEEPAAGTTLILVADAVSHLPATVVSRCERIRLSPPTGSIALEWLVSQHPDRSACQRALAFTSGAPLAALNLLGPAEDAGVGRILGELADDLQRLVDRAIPPTTVARAWAKRDAGLCLRWLYLQAAQLVRRQARAPGDAGSVRGALKIPDVPVNMAACCVYLDQLTEAQRLKDRSLNMEAMFADLLMWWYGAAGATRI